MDVWLLGTGAADGWPNPFCTCASCQAAAAEPRGQTAALVDDVLLLDCGPDVPRAAVRAGRSLASVRHVLITHDHIDHAGAAALLWRGWAKRREPLEVLGPRPGVSECRRWVAPTDPVRFREVRPGERIRLGSYEVRVLPAQHETETVLYDVTGPAGTSLLYATDTGPLPPAALEAVAGRGYELVLLEETFGDHLEHGTGHLDLATFPRMLHELRAREAITDDTDVVAIHLGHHNPPPAELSRRLDAWGARIVPDGTRLRLSAQPGGRGSSHAGPRRVLVLGGARSGKSTEAERLLATESQVVYAATGGSRPEDAEWQARVAEHRVRRPKTWQTVETTDLEGLLETPGPPVLIDCLTLWLTAVMDEHDAWDDDAWAAGADKRVRERVEGLTAALRATPRNVVMVSNEVGAGVVPDTTAGRRFRDELGRLNTRVAAACDEVLLVVAGRVIPLPPAKRPPTRMENR